MHIWKHHNLQHPWKCYNLHLCGLRLCYQRLRYQRLRSLKCDQARVRRTQLLFKKSYHPLVLIWYGHRVPFDWPITGDVNVQQSVTIFPNARTIGDLSLSRLWLGACVYCRYINSSILLSLLYKKIFSVKYACLCAEAQARNLGTKNGSKCCPSCPRCWNPGAREVWSEPVEPTPCVDTRAIDVQHDWVSWLHTGYSWTSVLSRPVRITS